MNSTNYRKLNSYLFINTLHTNVYLFIKSDASSLGRDDKLKLESPRKMGKDYFKSRNMRTHEWNTFFKMKYNFQNFKNKINQNQAN